MAKSRSKTALIKVIQKSDCPVYLIDGSHRLVYGNEALFAWINADAETSEPRASPDSSVSSKKTSSQTASPKTANDWIGTRLVYSSSADLEPNERLLCGLAPPPKLAAGVQAFAANVSIRSQGEPKQQENATAYFSFIDVPSDQRYLLAIVSRGDSDAEESIVASADTSETVNLHAVLRKLSTSIQTGYRCSALIGESPYVQRLQKQVTAASQHTHEFTIVGPAGSGREMLARTIMQQRQPPISSALDQGAPVTLHGYLADGSLVQSCVTQATRLATQVALETSNRSDKTPPWLLILDADQLDAASQTELWSALQSPSSRLRVLATAERDLIECVQNTGFHSGLAHLLTTQTIHTAALCQRLGDLSMLIQYEIENCNVHRQSQLSGLSSAAMQMMTQYHWPGDLAELAAIIASAAANCSGNEIGVDDLPEKFRFAIAALKSPPNEVIEIDLEKYLTEIEQKLVSRALRMAKGNKTKASKLLGVSRAKLLRRIQHFDLSQPPSPQAGLDQADLSADDFRPLDEPLFEEADE